MSFSKFKIALKSFISKLYQKNLFYKIVVWVIIIFIGSFVFSNIFIGSVVGVYLPSNFANCNINVCSGYIKNDSYLLANHSPSNNKEEDTNKKNITSKDQSLLDKLGLEGMLENQYYGQIPPKAQQYIRHSRVNVPSSNKNPSYDLSVYTIKSPYYPEKIGPNIPKNHWVIMVHGIDSDWTFSFLLGLKLLEKGINIVVYDNYSVMSRTKDCFGNYGSTGSGAVSFGLYESYGLQVLYEKLPTLISYYDHNSNDPVTPCTIGIYGVSMGAATVMIFSYIFGNKDYADQNSKLLYIFEDSGYFSFIDEVSSVLKSFVGFPFLFVYFGSLLSVILANGWDPYDITPGMDINKSFVPMYFVQGSNDNFVSFSSNFKRLLNSYYSGISLYVWKMIQKHTKKQITYFDFTVLNGSSHADTFFWNRIHHNNFIKFFEKIIADSVYASQAFHHNPTKI